MNNSRALTILVAVLTAALLASLGFLGRALWRNYGWEQEAHGFAGLVATEQAMEDFSQGKLRLLAIAGENDSLSYSGKKDGPFEVWNPQFFPSLGYPHRFVTERYVEFYNRKMRYMHEHPEKFLRPCCGASSDSGPRRPGSAKGGQQS